MSSSTQIIIIIQMSTRVVCTSLYDDIDVRRDTIDTEGLLKLDREIDTC